MAQQVGPERPGDETGALLAFLEDQREAIRRATLGLTEEQARQRPCASGLSLGGLLKHTAETEQGWLARAQGVAPDIARTPENWNESHVLLDGETLADTRAYGEKVARDPEEWIRSRPGLDETFPLPKAPWFPDADGVSLRWLLLHLIRENARHAGHADILREQLDGETAYSLATREG
ncbi:DinB family protein [Streptomyces sp. SPB074]|uniref:DinB family protein n=1 Tax=Streptomyces sp. (strain SPB074) TaxID=465543 RepID=UPI0001D1DEC8|nr:DinB family protein [Streptomyces sp. SPB074]EFG64870.1 conserved hypothetical protein [Streptomyces sp. SPB074]